MSLFKYRLHLVLTSALIAIGALPDAIALANTPSWPVRSTKKPTGPAVEPKRRLADRAGNRAPHIVAVDGSMNNGDYVNPSLCEVACFAATASFTTVPYFSLDQPRSITIAYNGDQAFPRPSLYVDINGQDATGVAVNSFTMSATLNGTPVTFLTGGTLLTFEGAMGWVRLAGQFDASALATNNYPVVITAKVFYADGTMIQKTINTSVIVVNEANSPIAKGWTVVGVQHLYSTVGGGFLVTAGDGSGVAFSSVLGIKATDYSRLTFDNGSSTYTRTYNDGSRIIFNSVGQEISAIEPNGRIATYFYDSQGRLWSVRDPYRKQPDGTQSSIGFAYDANGLHQIQEPGADGTDWHGRNTWFTVDASRCLRSAQDPDGVQTQYSCDSNGRLSTITDRRGGVTTIGYSAATWKLSTLTLPQIPVDAGGGSTSLTSPIIHFSPWQGTYAAYVSSLSASVQDPVGRTTRFTFNTYGQALDVTDPAGLHTTTTMYGILPTRVTHPNGWTDTVMYDTLGRVTRNHPAGGSPTNYHYNANGLVDVISGAGSRPDSLFYNANKEVSLEVFGGTPRQTMTYTYDPLTLRVLTAADNAGHTTTYAYDPRFGNLASTTVPGNRVSTTLFDVYGRDSVNTSPGVASRTTLYDVVNRVTSTSDGTATISLGYDQLFQTDLYDANQNHYHTDYNALGWPTQQCDALAHCSSDRYDASGMIMSTTNRRGQIVSLTRDGAGRVISKSGTNTVTDNYGYSADGRTMVAWNAVERDSIFTNPGSLTSRITDSVVTWIDGRRYRVYHSARNSEAGIDSTSILSNTSVTFKTRKANYDSSGALTWIFDGFNTTSVAKTGEGIGQLLTYAVGGTRTTSTTALHEVQGVAFQSGPAGSAFGRDYHYDMAGRIDQKHSVGDPTNAYAYGYDAIGRLQNFDLRSSCSASAPDSTSGNSYNCTGLLSHDAYSYDAMGNRLDHNAAVIAGNRYQSFNGATIGYDLDGNVSMKYDPAVANRDYWWSAESQLDSVVQNNWDRVRYDYNALGQPVRKLRNSNAAPNWVVDSYFLWDGDQLLAEFDPSGNRRSDYIYYPGTVDEPFAHSVGATAPTGVRYQQQDALGNVTGTMDNGGVSQTASYDAWGKLTLGGNSDNRLFWKGLMWEGDIVGLYYMRNRWYDPDLGRFISEDPAGFAGGANLYAFSGNDPVNANDPSGLSEMEPCTASGLSAALDAMASSGDDDNFSYTCGSGGGPTTLETVVVWGTPTEPAEPPMPQIPGDGSDLPPGGGGGSAGPTKPAAPSPDIPACKAAAISFVVSGGLDAFTLVGGVGIIVRGAVAYRAGTRVVTMSLGNPYARQNANAIIRRGLTELRTLGIGPSGAFPTSAGSGLIGQMVTGSEFNIRDYLPFVATERAYKAMNRACPS